jgi:septal ring factor EnvC (AmiA/AmiB activator)
LALDGAVAMALMLLLLTLPGTAGAQPESPLDMDRAEAELRLDRVLAEIGRLKTELESARTERSREQARLKAVDLEIQQADRALRALQQQQLGHQQELAALHRQRAAYVNQLQSGMHQLAEQLRWSYRSGRQSRIKLALNQDDPALLGRMLAYYEYYARAQTARISMLREAMTTLEVMQQSIDGELSRIKELAARQQLGLDQLDQQRAQRQVMLAELDRQIGSEGARLQELERNRQDLQALIEKLADVLADIPPDLGDHASVEKQKGRLPMPIKGPVKYAYGQARVGGSNWQGWLIGAQAGTEVRAIAHGRVAFADWLRGYGMLMIIDHGQGYMSLYGHNESLLREAGAWVGPGEVISLVGSNAGSGQGLYFELRKGGKAIDPAAWMAR